MSQQNLQNRLNLILRPSSGICLLVTTLLLSGCKTPKPVHVQRIAAGVEPTAAVVPTAERPNYVVGFMGGGNASWAVSSDLGATWTRHNADDPGFDWGQPAESPGGWNYGSDPTLVPTGNPNQVAFVSMASGRQVAIALSTDGGAHFGNAHLVSSPDDPNSDPEPMAAVNAHTGQIWVAWTNKHRARLMLRALHYLPNGTLIFDTPPMEITSLPGLDQIKTGEDVNVTVAAGDFNGTSHVALAYHERNGHVARHAGRPSRSKPSATRLRHVHWPELLGRRHVHSIGAPGERLPWVFHTFWGDYEALAVDNFNHTFIAAWTDNRFDGPPAIWAGVLNPLDP